MKTWSYRSRSNGNARSPYLQAGEFDVIVNTRHIYSSPKTTANMLSTCRHSHSLCIARRVRIFECKGYVSNDSDEEEAANFNVVIQEDIDLLAAKVKSDTKTGWTILPSAAKTAKVEFISFSTGGPLRDTLMAGQLDSKQ